MGGINNLVLTLSYWYRHSGDDVRNEDGNGDSKNVDRSGNCQQRATRKKKKGEGINVTCLL